MVLVILQHVILVIKEDPKKVLICYHQPAVDQEGVETIFKSGGQSTVS